MATISEILQAQGDAAAKARQARGTMWGSLAQYTGTIPREIIADRAQERERAQVAQVRQLQIQKGQAEAQQQQDEQGKLEVLRQVYRVAQDPTTGKLDEQRAAAIIAQSRFPELTEFMAKAKQAGLDKELEASVKRSTVAENAAHAKLYEAQATDLARPPGYKPPSSDAIKLGTYTASLGKPGAHWEDLSPKEQADYGAFLKPDTDTSAEMDAAYQKAIAKRNQGLPLTREETANVTAYERRKTLGQAATNMFITARQDASNPAVQRQAEKQYSTVLQRVVNSRSGGLGLQDQKVNQAIDLLAVFDQFEDPKKPGVYNIPPTQYNELALGLARLLSQTGQVGIQLEQEIKQRSAAGDIAGLLTYLAGTPFTGNTQAILTQMRDTIERQGTVAEQLRETYLDFLRSQAPTDLDEDRRQRLEQGLKLKTIATRPGLRGTGGAATTAAPGAAPSAAPITVTAPDGSVHPFATQAQADAFKRLAGIP